MNVKKLKNTLVLLIVFLFILLYKSNYAQKFTLRLLIKPASGQLIRLVGFEGLKTDSLATVRLDDSGAANIDLNYQGLVLLSFENGTTYPIVVNNSLTRFSILLRDSLQVVEDKENRFLYFYLAQKKALSRRQTYIKNALAVFPDNKPFHSELLKEKNNIIVERKKFEMMPDDSSSYYCAAMLKGMSLLELQSEVKTKEDLKVQKKIIMRFLKKNSKRVYNTNLIQQMATQYVLMDEFVAKTVDEQEAYIAEDVGTWIKFLGNQISSREIVNFYINYFMGRSLVGITAMLSNQYMQYVQCFPPVKKGTSLPDLSLTYSAKKDNSILLYHLKDSLKILYFFQSDCPACFGSEMALNRYLQNRKVKFPLIVVFSNDKAKNAVLTLTNLVLEPFYYTESEWLYSLLQVKKFPAIGVAGKDNTILYTCYSMEELINYLETKQR